MTRFHWRAAVAGIPLALCACKAQSIAPPPPPVVTASPSPPPPATDGACRSGSVALRILGLNDFHGQLLAGRKREGRPAGGAAVLAAYLREARKGFDDRCLLVHAGDLVGASPPSSALLQDEPTIGFLNLLAKGSCSGAEETTGQSGEAGDRAGTESACNVVATFGNHEFDEGRDELVRLIHGGNHARGPFIDNPYRGARFTWVSANVTDAATGKGLVAGFTIVRTGGVRVGVIGAVLRGTPSIVTPSGVAGLRFLDEVEAINLAVASLRARGVHAIAVAIHQGGDQPGFQGPTPPNAAVTGPIVDIVRALDDDVDLVVSGHVHTFTNAWLPTARGKQVLVTQAYSAGTAFADIDVTVDCASGDVTHASAQIVPTYADVAPGTTPDAAVADLVRAAEERTLPLTSRVVATAAHDLTARPNAAGESILGDLIADSQRQSMQTDVAFMNPGGIRTDVDAGPITWGELFAVEPFGNDLVALTLTGRQIKELLEAQWGSDGSSHVLQVSGIDYTWDAARPAGQRVIAVRISGKRLVLDSRYTACVNSFMAGGGDGLVVFGSGTDRRVGGGDLDALTAHLGKLKQPIAAAIQGRIKRLH